MSKFALLLQLVCCVFLTLLCSKPDSSKNGTERDDWTILSTKDLPDSVYYEAVNHLRESFVLPKFDSTGFKTLQDTIETLEKRDAHPFWKGVQEELKATRYKYKIFNHEANLDSFMIYYSNAVHFFEAAGFKQPLEKLYTFLAYGHAMMNEWEPAEYSIQKAETYSGPDNYPLKVVRLQVSGITATANGDYLWALQRMQTGLGLAEEASDTVLQVTMCLKIAEILDHADIHNQSLAYLKHAQLIGQTYYKTHQIATFFATHLLPGYILLAPDPDSARNAYGYANKWIREHQMSSLDYHHPMGIYYFYAGEPDSAVYYLRKSEDSNLSQGNQMQAMEDRTFRYRILLQQQKPGEVLSKATALIVKLKQYRQNGLLLYLYGALESYYRKCGQAALAARYLGQKDELYHRLFRYRQYKEPIIQQQIRFQQEEQQLQEEYKHQQAQYLLSTRLARNRWLLIGSFAVLGALALLSFVLFRTYKIKQQTSQRLLEGSLALEHKNKVLQHSNARLAAYGNIVSHDVITNLDLIISNGNILVGVNPDKKALNNYYRTVQKLSEELRTYCLRLLEDARQPGVKLLTTAVDPMPILWSVLERYNFLFLSRGISVQVDTLPATFLPETLVEQLFQNLISNMLKYGTSQLTKPVLKIYPSSVGLPGITHSWIIEDNGPGIAPEKAEDVFSVHKPFSSNNSGQHLGLYLLREQLRSVGADMWIEKGTELGARIVVLLPDSDISG